MSARVPVRSISRLDTVPVAMFWFVLATAAIAIGCDDADPAAAPRPDAGPVDAAGAIEAGDGGAADDTMAPADAGARADVAAACTLETADPPIEGANHTPGWCLPVQYGSNPPSSGTHYSSWPKFRAYDKPVPWGFLVHGLEHGAVVLAYNCPDGCAADVAAAKLVMAAAPSRECGRPVILTPDPTLTVRFAAASWGHILRASCFDRAAFAGFISAHVDQAPEVFQTDCGAIDLEEMGWCP